MNSATARKIKSKNSKIELMLGKAMYASGMRYIKNDTEILGTPDFSFRGKKIAVFCDSEFWHGKKFLLGEKFKKNEKYWSEKIKANIARDVAVTQELRNCGWRVIRFWGKDIEKNLDKCVETVKKAYDETTCENKRKIYETIDLFAGIGGIRLGFEQTGRTKNVFSCEIDPYACKTYEANFGENPFCDITAVDAAKLPNFDILLAGFPCQAFSIAGRRGGFNDTRGTLFFDVARIIKAKKPRAFLLENVKGLTNHDRGKTFKTIINVLSDELGYDVYYEILNAKDYGVAQKRERIYIVGFLKKANFKFPPEKGATRRLKDIIEQAEVSSKYYLSDVYLKTLKAHKARHIEKGNGFGFEILNFNDVANTLVVGGMGRERNLIIDDRLTNFTPKTNIKGEINKEFVRKLTPREWARLQGYPDGFLVPVSDAQAYKQFGNSVCVPVINEIAKLIIKELDDGQDQGDIRRKKDSKR